MSNWRIVFDPIWPFGPSAKDKRIAELERSRQAHIGLADAAIVNADHMETRLHELEAEIYRKEARWEDTRREGQQQVERLVASKDALTARLEHQRAELAQVHGELKLALELQANAITLTDTLVGKLCELRRDGFNPPAEPFQFPSGAVNGPAAAEKVDDDWLKITEAAQDRGGGSPGLYDKLMADATRWRTKGIAVKEIVQRIYEGFES